MKKSYSDVVLDIKEAGKIYGSFMCLMQYSSLLSELGCYAVFIKKERNQEKIRAFIYVSRINVFPIKHLKFLHELVQTDYSLDVYFHFVHGCHDVSYFLLLFLVVFHKY